MSILCHASIQPIVSAHVQVRVVIPPAAGSSQREPGYVMAQIREVITREPGTYRSAHAVIPETVNLLRTAENSKQVVRWAYAHRIVQEIFECNICLPTQAVLCRDMGGRPMKSPYQFGAGGAKTHRWIKIARGTSERTIAMSIVSNSAAEVRVSAVPRRAESRRTIYHPDQLRV